MNIGIVSADFKIKRGYPLAEITQEVFAQMAVRIRLSRHGKKKAPFYRLVVADSHSPRDGRFIEILGTYNPLTEPAEIKVDVERAAFWLKNGASPSDTAKILLKKAGVFDTPAAE